MVEIIKLQTNSKKQNKVKAGRFVLLGIVILYFIALFTTVAIVATYENKEKIGHTGAGGYTGSYYYKEIVFYDLDTSKGEFEIKASDFVLETYSKDIKAICFEGGATTYKVKRDTAREVVKVMFPRSDNYGYDSMYLGDVEYKDEEIEFEKVRDIGDMLLPILTFETVIFVIIFMMALGVVNNVGGSKPFKQKCREINECVVNELKERGFKSTKVFYMPSPRTGETNIEKMVLCVDKNNNKFAFVDYSSKECIIANYADVVKFDVVENNGVGMKQVSGTTIFNLPYTETETYNLCNKLQLVIVLDDENKSNVVYEFVKSGVRTNSNIYKEMSKTLIDVRSTLEVATGGSSAKESKLFVRCKYCGVKNKIDSAHCSSCGAVLD